MSIVSKETIQKFYAVIPAGGVGTRLWPLSRAATPKFLHDLTGSGDTLLRSTWERLLQISGEKRIMVVTGVAHCQAVKKQIPELDKNNLILEPEPKDSAAAICLAAAILYKREPDVIIGSFAADHVIRKNSVFQKAVLEAIDTANHDYIVTLGITPSYPATGFGYIKMGESLNFAENGTAKKVLLFEEKPTKEVAENYLKSGEYFWNAGMFVTKARLLLEHLNLSQPNIYAGVTEIAKFWDTASREEILQEIWPQIPKIAIDYAVAEPAAAAGSVAMVPANFDWDDVGDFSALARLNSNYSSHKDLTVLGDGSRILSETSSGVVVSSTKKLIALIGMEDVVVVDTEDALLVTTREHSQKVKGIVDSLKLSGNHDVL